MQKLIAYKRDFPHDIISVELTKFIVDNVDTISGIKYDQVYRLDDNYSVMIKYNTTDMGMHITADAMVPICMRCGVAIKKHYKYCPMCGRRINHYEKDNG